MVAGELHVFLLQVPAAQRRDVLGAKLVELLEQLLERTGRFQISKPVERIEAAVVTLFQDYSCARDPIGSLAIYEMRDDFAWAPGVGSFIDPRPVFGQIIEQSRDHGRRAVQYRNGFLELELQLSIHKHLLSRRMIRSRERINYFSYSTVMQSGPRGPDLSFRSTNVRTNFRRFCRFAARLLSGFVRPTDDVAGDDPASIRRRTSHAS